MDHIDSQENIKKNIITMETMFPVEQWCINEIDLWPYIRIKIYFEMLTALNPEEPIKNKNVGKIKFHNKLNKGISAIASFFRLQLFYLKLKKKKILFFGSHIHRVFQDDKYFNRFYDSIVDLHNLKNEVYMVEYQKVYRDNFNQKAIIPLTKYLNDYKLLLKFKKNPYNNKADIQLNGYEDFMLHLNNFNIDPLRLGVSKQQLLNWANKMKGIQGFFVRFYKNVNPNKVVFLGYYGFDDLYAALITANSLKIKTIDFQHGPQTNIHMAYSNWTRVPEKGYNTMPKVFWNWDENSKKNIDAWANKIDTISTKVFGQPYIAYWMNRPNKLNASNNGEVILYSMQTSPLELFTPKLINLIKQSEYNWIFRLHPRNNVDIEHIEKFLKKNGINNNAIIQDSIAEPLPQVLNRSILHITNYSGCTIEAKMMGVPTVLVHKVGMEMFNTYIDNTLVYYLDQKDDNFEIFFNDLIKKIKKYNGKLNYTEILNPLSLN